jgi:hypothetical protein
MARRTLHLPCALRPISATLPALAALVALGLSALAAPAVAHMAPLTDLQLAAGSSDVVVGVVEAARTRWNDPHTLLVTDYTLRIEDRLRGDAPRQVTLTIPGGTLDGETHSTCLSTPLTAGARYLLFLQELDRPALVPITGGWQGAFREIAGPQGKRLAASGPGEIPLLLANGDAVEFSQLVRAARHLLARSEAGAEPTEMAAAPEAAVFLPASPQESPATSGFVVSTPPRAPLVFEPLPPDSPFHGVDRQQIDYWNLYVEDLFQIAGDPTPGWGFRNGASEIVGFPTDEEMRQQTGSGWSRGAFSMTASVTREGRIVESDIALNPAYEWTLDEAAATRGNANSEVQSFRSSILSHLGYAWGYQGSLSFAGILRGDIVPRDSALNLKPQELDVPFLFAEDVAAARAHYPARRIRDGLISAYRVVPGPITPFYLPVTTSVASARPGGSFDLRTPITLENPGTEPLINPDVEVYLVPQRFSLDRAILVKRLRVRSTVPAGESLSVGLGRATVPRNARPGTYYLAFVLRDPRDAYQANTRTWGTEGVKLRVGR